MVARTIIILFAVIAVFQISISDAACFGSDNCFDTFTGYTYQGNQKWESNCKSCNCEFVYQTVFRCYLPSKQGTTVQHPRTYVVKMKNPRNTGYCVYDGVMGYGSGDSFSRFLRCQHGLRQASLNAEDLKAEFILDYQIRTDKVTMSCCDKFSVPVDIPGHCKKIFDSATCVYSVVLKANENIKCPLGEVSMVG